METHRDPPDAKAWSVRAAMTSPLLPRWFWPTRGQIKNKYVKTASTAPVGYLKQLPYPAQVSAWENIRGIRHLRRRTYKYSSPCFQIRRTPSKLFPVRVRSFMLHDVRDFRPRIVQELENKVSRQVPEFLQHMETWQATCSRSNFPKTGKLTTE